MNIFTVDDDPLVAARMLCDQHILKMQTESAQLLSAVVHLCDDPRKTSYKCMGLSHPAHSCTTWLMQSRWNYVWLVHHGLELTHEYARRYNKDLSWANIVIRFLNTPPDSLPDVPRTPFARAFGKYRDQLSHIQDPIEAYREYYHLDKKPFATWVKPDIKSPSNSYKYAPKWWRFTS